MERWIRITPASAVPAREARAVKMGELEIALAHTADGRFLAVENRCPHKGGPLADGIMGGTTVTCPLHAWRICLETGRVQKPAGEAACVRTFPVKVENDIVSIFVDPALPPSELTTTPCSHSLEEEAAVP